MSFSWRLLSRLSFRYSVIKILPPPPSITHTHTRVHAHTRSSQLTHLFVIDADRNMYWSVDVYLVEVSMETHKMVFFLERLK